MDDETVGVVFVLFAAAGFGAVGVLGIVAGSTLSIPSVLTLRFAVATIVVWALLWATGQLRFLSGSDLVVALGLGAVGYAGMSGFYFWGLEYLTAGLVAILLYTYPAFVIAATAMTDPSNVTKRLVFALGLSLLGVALIVGADPAGADPRGVLIMLGSALCYAAYVLGSGRILERIEPRVLTAHVLPASGLVFLVLGVETNTFDLPAPGATDIWLAVLALGVLSTALPILALNAGLRRINASQVSVVSTAEPAVAVVLGAVFLAEPVTATTILGGGLVLSGVILIERQT